MKKTYLFLALSASLAAQAEMILRRGGGSEPKSLDPQVVEGVPGANITRDLFEGLTTEDGAANIIPGVAESWTISEDGKTYTFKIRKDAKWSDGKAVTASDFVYGWQRGVNPETGSSYSFILYPIKNAEKIATNEIKDLNELGVKALDEHTLEVHLETPTPYFLGLLAHAMAYPAPQHIIEKHGKNWTRPENMVSNGAFKMKEWTPNASITLEKSENYWDKANVKLDKVIYYPIDDQNAELKRYRSDELDITYEIPNDQIKFLRENFKDELKIGNYLGTYYYGFNVTKPPFKDNPKLREALTLAVDREILTEKITGVGEVPAYSIVPEGVNGYKSYQPEYKNLSKEQRLEKAKALYAEAGYSKENPLKVNILYNTNENHKKIANAISAMWKQALGVEVTMDNQEWKVFLETRRSKEKTQVYRSGWIGDYNDPYSFLELFQSKSGLNDSGFVSEEFDRLLKLSGEELDAEKRFQILQNAEKILIDDYSLSPIYTYVSKHLVKPHVKGFTSNIMDHNASKYLWIEK